MKENIPDIIDSILLQRQIEFEKLTGLQRIYTSQIGVREKTNNNDGPEIEMYLKSVGLYGRYAWCAAFVRWAHDSAGYKTSINGLAASAHRPDNLVFFKNKFEKNPQPGDVFCLWFPNLKRIGHTGFWDREINESIYETVEGNTNGSGGREGDGVYKIKRSYKTTYSISRWTDENNKENNNNNLN